jgi:hypothetical protein
VLIGGRPKSPLAHFNFFHSLKARVSKIGLMNTI